MKLAPLHIHTRLRRILADTLTPVGIFLGLRDRFRDPLLLEAADSHSRDDSYSFICLEPLASFQLQGHDLVAELPTGKEVHSLGQEEALPEMLSQQFARFQVEATGPARRFNGFFGHSNFDAVTTFEQIEFRSDKPADDIPQVRYAFYRYIIVINHFNEEAFLIENHLPGQATGLDRLERMVMNRSLGRFSFKPVGEELKNMPDERYLDMVKLGKNHCQRGNVFQVVLSRRFSQAFEGDDFNVYRALRSINPSPYLFYFDYGSYRLFGSSPEAQLVSNGKRARIHPIAGTFRRTGDDEQDAEAARQLAKDPKENAEHVMLVDLARNDLGRNAEQIEVTHFREVQYFSHVIHLVSTVEGDLPAETNPIRLLADTFPAGTLSGAPKIRAMQIIDAEEPTRRGYYGGAIGQFGLDGEVNHAIMIRSFFSRNNTLHYQAGAGIVVDSVPEKELQEVDNKLAALRKAMQAAKDI